MKKTKLSICIPTFNRISLLCESLDIIFASSHKEKIQVIVYDNSTNDITQNILREKYSSEIGEEQLLYHKNPKNIGIDKNMMSIFEHAKADYVWWLGDDDRPYENRLNEILEIVETSNKDVILLNSYKIAHDTKIITKEKRMRIDKDIVISNPKDFFVNYWAEMPFGTVIFNKNIFDKFLSSLDVLNRYDDTSHAYSGLVMDLLLAIYNNENKNDVLIKSKVSVLLGVGKKTWSPERADIYYRQIPKWFDCLPDFYKPDSQIIKKNFVKEIFSFYYLLRLFYYDGADIEIYRGLIGYISRIKLLSTYYTGRLLSKIIKKQ